MSGRSRVGVLLMTFGSAVTSAEVPAYLRSVRGGREPSSELISEFARRFDVIGRSPLIDITLEQAAALERRLTEHDGVDSAVVAAGMLHSEPSIATSLRGLIERGAMRVVAIVLAPQYSPLILTGYARALDAAVAEVAPLTPVRLAGAWHTMPSWIASLAERVHAALDGFDPGARVAVVFTAHSLPRPVVERDPDYMVQVHETIAAVVASAGLAADRWQFAFQSAGHTPEEWLTPDLVDVLPGIQRSGATDVLVVPVQFLTDHLEILYDIDVAAAEQARSAGLRFHRIAMPNAGSRLIDALAEVVHRELVTVQA